MSGIIIILEIILVMFLWSEQFISVLLWIISIIMFQMSFGYGNEHFYLEIIEDYPAQDCVKPGKLKFLFKKLIRLSYKDIPKEMYYCEIIKVCGFGIYSLVLSISIFINEYIASLMGVIYRIC